MTNDVTHVIESIRDRLTMADDAHGDKAIGHILIALGQIVDLIEAAQPARFDAIDRRIDAIDRRIDAIGRSLRALADRDE